MRITINKGFIKFSLALSVILAVCLSLFFLPKFGASEEVIPPQTYLFQEVRNNK